MKDDLYYSNGGRGPGVARIRQQAGGDVAFEWKPRLQARRWQTVTLPEEFFFSPACGWRQRKAETKR